MSDASAPTPPAPEHERHFGEAELFFSSLQLLAAEGASHGLPAARERLRPHIARLHAVGATTGALKAA